MKFVELEKDALPPLRRSVAYVVKGDYSPIHPSVTGPVEPLTALRGLIEIAEGMPSFEIGSDTDAYAALNIAQDTANAFREPLDGGPDVARYAFRPHPAGRRAAYVYRVDRDEPGRTKYPLLMGLVSDIDGEEPSLWASGLVPFRVVAEIMEIVRSGLWRNLMTIDPADNVADPLPLPPPVEDAVRKA